MGHEVFVCQVEDSGLSVVHIVPRKAPGRVRAISCQGGKAQLPSHIHSTDNSTAAITDGAVLRAGAVSVVKKKKT